MAKIFHTALVSSIHKKMHGTILRRRKGYTLSSKGQKPRDPHSARQVQLRGHFNYLSGKWPQLTENQKGQWNTYASGLDRVMSGFNSYVMLNTRLLAANYSTLVIQDTPPTTPATPDTCVNFTVTDVAGGRQILGWTAPTSPDLYALIYRSEEPGLSYTGKHRWHLLQTVPSDHTTYTSVHEVPSNIPITYRVTILDPQGRISPYTHAAQAPPLGTLYVCDYLNDRIKEHLADDLAYSRKFGTLGSGDDQFNRPWFCAADGDYLYISDRINDRVKKHRRANFQFIAEYTDCGDPAGIALDDDYVYFIDNADTRLKKLSKDTMAYVSSVNVYVNHEGIDIQGDVIYMCRSAGSNIRRVRKSTMTIIGDWDYFPDPYKPYDIHCGDNYFWVANLNYDNLLKLRRSNGNVLDTYGTLGSGDAQFNSPAGITGDDTFLWISDTENDRIKKHQKSDWAFVQALGTSGSGNDQFQNPQGIAHWIRP